MKTIYALGFFDGVHLGHQALLTACRALAEMHRAIPGAVTFTAHPETLTLGKAPALLNTVSDRVRLLKAFGMDCVTELAFDKRRMETPWEMFLTQLTEGGAAGFVCGADFRFGAGGRGNAESLAAFCQSRGLPWAIVPQQTADGERVSSTRIRALLETGDVERANRLLGHPHILSGEVVTGRQLGRTIGVPTANLAIPRGILTPKFGVYATKVTVEGRTYAAVTNIGTRPTVNGQDVTAEAHLLDFTGELYGKAVTVTFYAYLRPEEKFPSLDALKTRITADIAQTRKIIPL